VTHSDYASGKWGISNVMAALRAARAPARVTAALLAVAATAVFTSYAVADVAGAGPDETASQAFGPLHAGIVYDGAFANQDDVDYLAFTVPAAGTTLNFSVQNTTQVCNDPYDHACPVYLTLMDATGTNQVGGSASDAGTIATYGDTESFPWTFTDPGTYYILMESDGDLSPGNPAYAVGINVTLTSGRSGGGGGSSGGHGGGGSTGGGSSGGGSGGSGGGANPPYAGPLVRSLKVLPRQHGDAVKATIVLGQFVPRIRATLSLRHRDRSPTVVTARTFRRLSASRHRLVVLLPAAYRRRLASGHALPLVLRLTLVTSSGARLTVSRRVRLTG
jgi:hypothetical protein